MSFATDLVRLGFIQKELTREKKGLQESNRKFKALEKSLWVPLADRVIMKVFSEEILSWKRLLKIPCLFFSNINLLKAFLKISVML